MIPNILPYNGDKREVLPYIMQLISHYDDMTEFNDVFGGSGVVALNMSKDGGDDLVVNYNEYDINVFKIIDALRLIKPEVVCHDLQMLQDTFGPTKGDKPKFDVMREHVNSIRDRLPHLMIGLTRCAFSSTPRWRKDGGFNNPYGNRDWRPNDHLQTIIDSHEELQKINMFNNDYRDYLSEHLASYTTVDYYDPPYTITTANYFHGWNSQSDLDLIDIIERRESVAGKFILSNVIHHRDKTNQVLLDWIERRPDLKVFYIDRKTYQIANRIETNHGTVEVLITNINGEIV